MVRFRKKGCNWGKGDSRRDSRKQCKKAVRKSDPEKQCKETIRRSNPKKQSEKAIRKSNPKKQCKKAIRRSNARKRSEKAIRRNNLFLFENSFRISPVLSVEIRSKNGGLSFFKNLCAFFYKPVDVFQKTLRCFRKNITMFFGPICLLLFARKIPRSA